MKDTILGGPAIAISVTVAPTNTTTLHGLELSARERVARDIEIVITGVLAKDGIKIVDRDAARPSRGIAQEVLELSVMVIATRKSDESIAGYIHSQIRERVALRRSSVQGRVIEVAVFDDRQEFSGRNLLDASASAQRSAQWVADMVVYQYEFK